MNITKNKLIEALKYLGKYPKTNSKKEELIHELYNMYNEANICKLVKIINYNIYDLIKRLVNSNGKGIYVDECNGLELDFLETTLIIEEPVVNYTQIYINFAKGMKEKFEKFINKKTEKEIRNIQGNVDLIINILETYGVVKLYYDLPLMLNRMLKKPIEFELILELININIDLRRNAFVGEDDDGTYVVYSLIEEPSEIILERRMRDLECKILSLKELEDRSFSALIMKEEAQKIVSFLERKETELPELLTIALMFNIMAKPQMDIIDYINIIDLKFKNMEEAEEYIQLVTELNNNIPHYCLYGYSPKDLIKLKIEEKNKDTENKPIQNIIKVDFKNKSYNY